MGEKSWENISHNVPSLMHISRGLHVCTAEYWTDASLTVVIRHGFSFLPVLRISSLSRSVTWRVCCSTSKHTKAPVDKWAFMAMETQVQIRLRPCPKPVSLSLISCLYISSLSYPNEGYNKNKNKNKNKRRRDWKKKRDHTFIFTSLTHSLTPAVVPISSSTTAHDQCYDITVNSQGHLSKPQA